MIIVPEIETVVILVPRTGSTSLRKALLKRYPEAMPIYRHMEADGVPDGYERWQKIGVVRDPLSRLASLYCYLKTFDGPYPAEYIAEQRASVASPFSEWIVNNLLPFTQPYDSSGQGRFYPKYNLRHNLPETRKSQYVYLRPDLGTICYKFIDLPKLAEQLDIELPHENRSVLDPQLELTDSAKEHLLKWFAWDIAMTCPKWVDNKTLLNAVAKAGTHGRQVSKQQTQNRKQLAG